MTVKPFDVVILTDKRYLEDSKTDVYKHHVFYEDFLVQDALNRLGLNTLRLAWDDDSFDWVTTKTILFRTTWDYFHRFKEFSSWLSKVAKQTTLLNSETIIRWNIDKHYFIDLEQQGITITPTHFIEQNTPTSLRQLHETLEWNETVLKPCISGSARHTYRLTLETIEAHEALFQSLITHEAMMLQPFQHQIVTKGEVSMMVFNGQFTHAVLKQAKAGDFRVQDDFGGSVSIYHPSSEEISFAEKATKSCPELPIYARVDIFTDNNGSIALSELELIEPELWFRYCPDAATILANAIKVSLTK